MKLSVVQDQINSSELSSLSKANKTDDIIISCINLGLIELYKRFNISTKAEVIRATKYNPVCTIVNPKINQLLDVYDEEQNRLIGKAALEAEDYDYIQVSYNTFMLREPKDATLLAVFKAAPELLEATTSGDYEIELPYAMLEALVHYTGYRLHNSIGGSSSIESSNLQYAKFERSCANLVREGYAIEPHNVVPATVNNKGFM